LQIKIDEKLRQGQTSSLFDRRGFLKCVVGASSFMATIEFSGLQAQASEEKLDEGEGVVGAFKTLFDPNERTKSGKELPKAYLKSAREVVKTMRESLKENPKDNAKFRRSADAAKESIRDYLSNWRGQKTVAGEVCLFNLYLLLLLKVDQLKLIEIFMCFRNHTWSWRM